MNARRISIGIASAVVALACVTAIPAASTVSAALPTFLRYSATAKAKESFVVTRRFHARGPTLASFPAAGTGRVRVVVESGSPAAAQSSIEGAGRPNRTLVAESRPGVRAGECRRLTRARAGDRARACPVPARRGGRERRGGRGRPRSGLAREGLHRQERQSGDHRRRLRWPHRSAGGGGAADERRHPGLLWRPVRHGDASRNGRRRDRARDGAGRPASADLRRHRGRSRQRGGVREGAGRQGHQPLDGLVWTRTVETEAGRSAQSSTTPGRPGSCG